MDKAPVWDYFMHKVTPKPNPMGKTSVKGVQFEQPLLEYSGACAGCGETPYAKLATQLFGDRMMIANATGCTSIWGASAPAMPYTKNAEGHGPSWANSLFEDNAEYGLGMFLGVEQSRNRVKGLIADAIKEGVSAELQAAMEDWTKNMNVTEGTRERAAKLAAALKKEAKGKATLETLLSLEQYFIKRSHWIFGGDGWGYDIGYGGLGPCSCQRQECQRAGLRYRSLLQYWRTIIQGYAYRSGGTICCQRQADQEKGFGHDGYELRLRLCGAGSHGLR
jgi:pyruvate-ferredoxin/flavodoxin oxidoreductase